MDRDRPPLIALPAPPRPTDLTPSALFIPISSISLESHRGRKIRTFGQILAFDPASSMVLLASSPIGPTGKLATILANTSVPLLGTSPALRIVKDKGELDNNYRPKLKMEKGEWVSVVGWLEGEAPSHLRDIDPGDAYFPPIPLVLELILIMAAREPPQGAMYRGDYVKS